ncbi:MAG: hypothetical protein KJ739_09535 [Nitrospinae bacterium]|nr:hypothetical protein [Nitrospinota bacterium]
MILEIPYDKAGHVKIFINEQPCGLCRRVSKNPIFVLLSLSFPLVGNPSERFWTSQNDRIR